MSWSQNWLWGSSNQPKVEKVANQFPDRAARVRCWDSRDVFFACLDKNGIIDAIKEDEKAKQSCSQELKGYENNCAAAWVTYFKQRRLAEFEKAKLLQEQTNSMFKS